MLTRYTVTSERLGEGIRVFVDGDPRDALDRAVSKRYRKRAVWQANGAGLQGFMNGNTIIYLGAVWEPVKGWPESGDVGLPVDRRGRLVNVNDTIGDKDLAKVLDKVAKLFALAGRTTSVEEAETAVAQAEAIIAKYRLQAVDVDWVNYAAAPHDGSVVRSDEPLWSGRRSQLWTEELAKFLCEHYGCFAYVSTDDRTTHYVIVGRPSDVELCRYMFGWLTSVISRLSQPEKGHKARASFCSGAVAAISRTMRRAARAEARAEGAAGAAIVLASRSEEAERFAREAEPGMRVKHTRAREDAAARARGYEAGKRVHVGPTLPAGSE